MNMKDRMPWLQEARKRHYRTLLDWVAVLHNLGWPDVPESTLRNWEASGFLPTSLDYKAINLISESLRMTPNEILRLQGVKIVETLENSVIPACAANFVQELINTDEAILEQIMPMIEAHFQMLRSHASS